MPFSHDAAEPTTGGGVLLPEGPYELVITDVKEQKSKAGDPQVNVTCEVMNNPEFNGARVYHNVTFLPKDKKGAGMASHFLKCINQPYQGPIEVDPEAWKGEKFQAIINHRAYKKEDGTEVVTNNIKSVLASEDTPF